MTFEKRTSYVLALFHLLRTQMTTISAVTHLSASLLSPNFSLAIFVRVWLFILLTQFATHYLGDYYDRRSDMLNQHASPFTGGSRQIARGAIPPHHVLLIGRFLTALSFISAVTMVPPQARLVAMIICAMAYNYSAPPLRLNHCGWGELDATIVTSVLLPILSIRSQRATPPLALLAQLLIPPTLCKFALFLTLNLADRRADFAAGKMTLAVYLGARRSAQLHQLLTWLSYVCVCVIALFDAQQVGAFAACRLMALMWLSMPVGLNVSSFLKRLPYQLHGCLPAALVHSSLLVWAVLVETALRAGGLDRWRAALTLFLAWRTFGNALRALVRAGKSSRSARATGEVASRR